MAFVFLFLAVLITACFNSNNQMTHRGAAFASVPSPIANGIETQAPNKSTEFTKSVNCEDVLLYLDDSIKRAGQREDTYLIIVGRLGKNESVAGLNRTRLQQIEKYVGRKFTGKLLLAEGPRVNGLGRVEIYIEGRLAYVMPLATNARFFCPTPVG